MPRTPEAELQLALEADPELMGRIKAVYGDHVPRAVKTPYIVLSLLNDPNGKEFLSYYGGIARVQLDLYSRDADDSALRVEVKKALRGIRGISNDYHITSVIVTNEQSFGLEETGLYRWVIDVEMNYTEE